MSFANKLLSLGGTLALGGGFLSSFFYTVDAGEKALLFDRAFQGIKENIYGEGMHFYIPFFQVNHFDNKGGFLDNYEQFNGPKVQLSCWKVFFSCNNYFFFLRNRLSSQ